MKYLMLPIHLLKFWYIESLSFFLRTLKNLILFIDEDLAVTLMWKLIFIPLFHDSSIVGRILSFIFRLLRILIGLFAYSLATVSLMIIALIWMTLPIGVIWGVWGIWGWAILFVGVGLFITHIITHPHKEVWQAKNLWDSSLIKRDKVNLLKLLSIDEVKTLLSYLEVAPENFSQFNISDLDQLGNMAYELAKKTKSKYIDSCHFFVAGVKLIPGIENYLLKLNLKIEDFEEALNFLELKKNKWRVVYIWDSEFAVHHLKGVNRGWLGVPTHALDLVSEDITNSAARENFPEIVGRKTVVFEAINLLSEEGKRNVLLVGSPGAGKSSLINFLAKQILSGDAPPALATKRLVKLDTTRLLSGIHSEGELAERVKQVFDEVSFAGNIILVIEEIHNLGIGEAGSSWNLYSLILPFLESANFQFLATTEVENYTKILEKNGSFARLFTKVELPPANKEETLEILEEKAIDLERRKKIRVSVPALNKLIQLSLKLVHDRVLPDSAITVLDEAVTYSKDGWITQKIIEETFSKRVNVPTVELGNAGKEKLLNLENEIHTKLIDQEEAVKAVSDSLRRSATGLRAENRPIGSFLFVGPTGVGKTELAKILANVYFSGSHTVIPSVSEESLDSFQNKSGDSSAPPQNDRDGGGAFVRFDMSEYQSADSVNKMIGGPGMEGLLTEVVRIKQYCLLLLDEFEKADPKILTLFLQVLEDGRLTDGTGKLVDFTNTIIIATSNAASVTIAKGLDKGQRLADLKKEVNEELLEKFSPELINRFDDVILFKPLSGADLEKIVRLKLLELQAQLKEKGYLIEFDQGLVDQLSEKGFNPVLGARPLRRLIQDTIEAKLSRMILENKLQKGSPFKIGVEMLG